MKKIWAIFLLAFVVVNAVAFTVFLTGNSPQQPQVASNNTNPQGQNNNVQQNNQDSNVVVTASDLSNHDSQSDCWVGYDGKVYDLTAWLPKHPGSAGAIAPYCGTSQEFENAFKDQHGTSQVQRMVKESVYKGELK